MPAGGGEPHERPNGLAGGGHSSGIGETPRVLVSMDSCPRHSAITVRSTPAWSNPIAAVCRLCLWAHSRHSTATHLLRAGVDLNTIRSWPSHVSIDTTQIYAEIDLEMKARALEKCSTADVKMPTTSSDGTLMVFLREICQTKLMWSLDSANPYDERSLLLGSHRSTGNIIRAKAIDQFVSDFRIW